MRIHELQQKAIFKILSSAGNRRVNRNKLKNLRLLEIASYSIALRIDILTFITVLANILASFPQ